MFRYILKRLLYAIPVFLGITFVIYTLINLAPGGPLSVLAASGEMSLSDLEALKISMGLDKPIVIRYFIWLGDLLHGDFGISYRTSQEVSLMISQRIMPSLMLTGTGILAAMLVGVPLGIISAYKPNSVWDHISTFISFIGASVPNFFLSLLLIYVLAVKLKWFPTSGMQSSGMSGNLLDLLHHLALPAFVCGIQPIGNYIKQTRSSVLEVLNEEYIKTARSKGLTNVVIVLKHAFRNALIPIVTTISLSIPFLIGGAVVTEQIFAWPGYRKPDDHGHYQPRLPGDHGCGSSDLRCGAGGKSDPGPDLCGPGSADQV